MREKKKISGLLLVSLIGLVFVSCELQEEAIHQHVHNSNAKLYEMKFEELMTNKSFVTSFSKLPKSKKNLTTAALGRTVMENEYGFTIADKPAKVIEDNGETSYTFLITRDSTDANSFENLVIQTDSTNTTKAVILKYNLTSPITSSADDSYSFTYNREIIPIVYNNTTVSETSRMVIVCYWVYSLVCNNTRTGEIGPEHIAGPKCRRTYYNWTEECSSFDDGFSNGGGGGSSYNGGSGGTGGANSINTSPVNNSIEFSETVSNFLQSLSPEQLEYWNGLSTREQKNIVDYLEQPSADVEFVIQFLENSINSGLNLDFKKSLKSPANIDFSEIDKTTIEGQKLDCIYQKLMQSPSFENLFHNTFGGNQTKLNVKFEIANNLPDNIGGVCQLQPTVNGAYTNLIRININHLIGMNAKSNLINARTILHECIHAYLNIKKINCNLGTTIPELNGLDLQSLIGTFYQSFGCHIDVNGSLQSQHDFIFTYLIPSFRNIFSDIYNLLASESNINYVNNTIYNNSLTGENFTWNWNDFFKYYSMEGLHLCDSFVSAIQNVPNENFKYNFYKNEAQNFIKNCQ